MVMQCEPSATGFEVVAAAIQPVMFSVIVVAPLLGVDF
jgi:hypothetical protein